MPVLTLTKHHGLGNDFLVALDQPVDGVLARAVCDRHRGVGADGLIGARVEGTTVTMELYNSDGSRAEVSGNGLACLAQAVGRDRIDVHTDAGLRAVTLDLDRATVDMGGATTKEMEGGLFVDMGNPHLVLRDEGQDLRLWPAALDSQRRTSRPDAGRHSYAARALAPECDGRRAAPARAHRRWPPMPGASPSRSSPCTRTVATRRSTLRATRSATP